MPLPEALVVPGAGVDSDVWDDGTWGPIRKRRTWLVAFRNETPEAPWGGEGSEVGQKD